MKKRISLLALVGVFAASTAYGSGYRIPEQSINSTALANAYVANTRGADTSYFNPANMSFLEPGWHTDTELMYIHLPEISYNKSSTANPFSTNGKTKEEDFVMPVVHAVSPEYNNFRFGFSLTYPAGLSKRWADGYPRTFAEDFTLKTIELNPTVSYKFCDIFSAAVGARIVKTDGEVRSHGTIDADPTAGVLLATLRRDLEGDALDYGYNVAISAKPIENLTIAATYRSKVLLEVEGEARLELFNLGGAINNRDASVNVPMPAVFTIGTAYQLGKTTVELNYDKTYWSEYENLDFNYTSPLSNAILIGVFDNPSQKNWSNTDAFRIGITHKCTDNLTTMIGFAIDENPVPDKTLGFELPDSDAKLYSLGFKYKLNEQLEVGAAYLYDDKEERTIAASAANSQGVDGTFTDAGAHLFNVGANYSF